MNRYITQVKLKNFQDHADTTIDFTNGINLIVGSSDAGKSAILRAINLVFHNNFKRDTYIRHGEKECSVSVKFSDGVEVTRIKGEDVNSYLLTDAEGNIHSFPKVGTGIPDEIKKNLGNPPLDDKKRPISYSDQMSSLFLVDLSSSDLPRTLSELTGIQHLQTSAELLSKTARSYDRSIKDKKEKIEKLETELDNYSYVDKDLERIEDIVEKLKDVNNQIEKSNRARFFIEQNNKIFTEAKQIKVKLAKEKAFAELKENFDELLLLNKKVSRSIFYLSEYQKIAKEYKKTKSDLLACEQFLTEENKDLMESVKKLIDINTRSKSFIKNDKDLKDLITTESTAKELEEQNVKNLKEELNLLIDELKLNGNWCESCNRPLI
jgi:DNA repair exonuclease SbcCD ATPase subunit